MDYKKIQYPFWFGATVALTILFAVLLPILMLERYGLLRTIFYTIIAEAFTWVNYFVRMHIYSHRSEDDSNFPG